MKEFAHLRLWGIVITGGGTWLSLRRGIQSPYLEIGVIGLAVLAVLVGESVAARLRYHVHFIPDRFSARCGVLVGVAIAITWIALALGWRVVGERAADVGYLILLTMVATLIVEAVAPEARSAHITSQGDLSVHPIRGGPSADGLHSDPHEAKSGTRSERHLDRVADRLDRVLNTNAEAVGFCQMTLHQRFVKSLDLPPDAAVLSVSCGDATLDYLTQQAHPHIGAITATDIVDCPVDAADIKLLRERCQWNFVKVASERPLPFLDGSFDLVFHHDVVEHVLALHLFLDEQFRVLRPGGYLICGTPNLLRPMNLARLALGRLTFPVKIGENAEIGDYIHIQEFTPWTLRTLLEEIGFRDIRLKEGFLGIHPLNLAFVRFPTGRLGKLLAHYLVFCARKPVNSEH